MTVVKFKNEPISLNSKLYACTKGLRTNTQYFSSIIMDSMNPDNIYLELLINPLTTQDKLLQLLLYLR